MDKTEQLIQAAHQLFEQQGFHATGVDQIAQRAGVTKRTLYKHFGSKEGLITTVLKEHHITTMLAISQQVEGSGKDSAEAQLMRCFELYGQWFSRKDFAGCIYIKTLNEFSGCSSDLCKVASQCKQAIRDYLAGIAAKGCFSDPERLADQLQLLLEGSIIVAQCNPGPAAIETARSMAHDLISSSARSS